MSEAEIKFLISGTGKHNFGCIPDPPEPPSDRWQEEHCPRCKWNHEWQEGGKSYSECLQGGCTGFEEKECNDTYQEGMCESCDRFEICEKIWEGDRG